MVSKIGNVFKVCFRYKLNFEKSVFEITRVDCSITFSIGM